VSFFNLERRIVILTAVMLLFGSILIIMIYRQTDKQLKDEFLLNGNILIQMLDVKYIKVLTGSTDDYVLDEFQYLHSKFREMIHLNDVYQYIYVMRKNDKGEIVFLIDVGNVDNPQYDPSLPGEIYEETNEGIDFVYTQRLPVVYGPVTDRFGSWVSALFPIIDPESDEMIGFLGMDKDAFSWKLRVVEKLAFPIFFIILIYYLSILSFKISKQKHYISQRSERLNKQKLTISDLTLSEEFNSNDFTKKLELICEKVSICMSVEMVSIWFLKKNSDVMECQALYSLNNHDFTSGIEVDLGVFENFIEERFNKESIIALENVKKDKQFYDCYLKHDEDGQSIKSVIYASFYENRRLSGYLAIENYKNYREWTADEEIFIDNITAIIQQLVERFNKEKAEIELIQTNNRFLKTLDSMMDGFIYFDKDLFCKYINNKTAEIFGIPYKNYVNVEIWDIIPHEFLDFLRDLIQLSLFEKKEQMKTEFVKSLNKWIEFRVYTVDNDIACIFMDVTFEKQKEKIFLENQRLSVIGETTTSFAHDFNNYLQVILANIQVMNSKLEDHVSRCPNDQLVKYSFQDKMRKHINTIQTVTNDAATRVQILQRYAGSKQSTSEYNKINLNIVVQEAILQSKTVWKTEPERYGIAIDIKEKYSITPDIFGNDSELRSVIYGLIQNSVEAMPNGGTITFETKDSEEGVYLLISDTGSGINNDILDKIFEPFFTTKSFNIGKGLGLSNAYSIISEHNGTMRVFNTKIGGGTTFEIVLPYFESNGQQTTKSLKKEKEIVSIMWVDDDEIIRNIAEDMIADIGHEVITAESGQKALEILQNKKFDILLTDIGMPNMNGWQLIEKINEIGKENMKIAVISGWGAQIPDSQKEEYGVEYVLSKPVKLAQLKKLIDDCMDY